jgi:hypothetical protein
VIPKCVQCHVRRNTGASEIQILELRKAPFIGSKL